jgi:hypothetical protein
VGRIERGGGDGGGPAQVRRACCPDTRRRRNKRKRAAANTAKPRPLYDAYGKFAHVWWVERRSSQHAPRTMAAARLSALNFRQSPTAGKVLCDGHPSHLCTESSGNSAKSDEHRNAVGRQGSGMADDPASDGQPGLPSPGEPRAIREFANRGNIFAKKDLSPCTGRIPRDQPGFAKILKNRVSRKSRGAFGMEPASR